MLTLAAFAAIALLAAGLFAALKGDTFIFAVLLVVLALVALVAAPQAPALLAHIERLLNTSIPLAAR